MAGVTPTEGKNDVLSVMFETADTFLGLYENSSGLGVGTEFADLTPQDGAGAAEKTLLTTGWTITGGQATYADQDFLATADWVDATYGYYIRTAGNILRHFENSGSAVGILDTQTYRVILDISL